VVHRDVRPENIMLDGLGHVALGDFDLVKADDVTRATEMGSMGTFVYAPPEQQRNAANVDERADVYALGMTALFCVLRKEPPGMVAKTEPGVLDKLPCDKLLARAIKAAVAYERERRASDCFELAQALRQARRGRRAAVARLATKTEELSAVDPQRASSLRGLGFWAAVAVLCLLFGGVVQMWASWKSEDKELSEGATAPRDPTNIETPETSSR
jgi:serine/threonine protein kinase